MKNDSKLAEELVKAITSEKNLIASKALEQLLQKKCATKISNTLVNK